MSVVESYVKTRQQVEERVARRKAEFTALCLLCEESLHLLWVHLDLYLRRNLPRLGHPLNGSPFFCFSQSQKFSNTTYSAESLLEPCFQATANELSHLKQQVVVGISDRVEAQILEAVKVRVLKLDAFLQIYNWFWCFRRTQKEARTSSKCCSGKSNASSSFPLSKTFIDVINS